MSPQEQAIRRFYREYLAAFHTSEASSVTPFYATPCLFIADSGTTLLSGRNEIEHFFSKLIASLKARDYDHSDVNDLEVVLLSERLAQVTGLAIRYAKDGSELEQTRATYLLHEAKGTWKFVTVIAYP